MTGVACILLCMKHRYNLDCSIRGWGSPAENIGNFTQYRTTLKNQRTHIKTQNVALFVHTFDDYFGEGLGMLDDNGNPKMPFFTYKDAEDRFLLLSLLSVFFFFESIYSVSVPSQP